MKIISLFNKILFSLTVIGCGVLISCTNPLGTDNNKSDSSQNVKNYDTLMRLLSKQH